jgi:hypothetical protein
MMNKRRYFGVDDDGKTIPLPNLVCLRCNRMFQPIDPGWFDQDSIEVHNAECVVSEAEDALRG